MPDAANANRSLSRAGRPWTRVLALLLVLGLVPGLASSAFAEISRTPATRFDDYKARMQESRVQEQKLMRNMPKRENVPPQRFQHPSKKTRPLTSADRSPLVKH